MKTRRWMDTVLAESRKDKVEMPWARQVRAKRRAAKVEDLKRAG